MAHLGGALPYLAERLHRGFHAFAECRRHIEQPPGHYLRGFYYDTVNFDPAALRLAIGFAGIDHILAGSDFPHQIGSLRKMLALSSMASSGLPSGPDSGITSPSRLRGVR
ncbi:MAG: amidohydrolase family protein [Bryobacteraceae bacterium]